MVVYLGKATPASGSGGGTGAAVWGDITGTLANQTDLVEALAAKQDVLTAGTGIDITNGVISATGGGGTPESILDARTETAIRLWTGNQTQYNNGGTVTFYNWKNGGWQTETSGTWRNLYAVANDGNGTYIAVGESGTILVSIDEGKTWTSKTSGISQALSAIAYNPDDDIFIAVTDINGASCCISTDSGDTWTVGSCASKNLHGIAYGNGKWIAVGNEGDVVVSTDNGANWTRYQEKMPQNQYAIVYNPNNQKFYCAGNKGSIYSSTDGSTWTEELYLGTSYLYGITIGNGKLVAVGGRIYSSSGNGTWTEETSSSSQSFRGIVYGNSKFYAVGDYGSMYSSSGDGTWTEESSGVNVRLYGGCYGNNLVVVGTNGTLLTSDGNPALSVYTTDENPTTESTVYSDTTTQSALTITAVGTGEITLSDTNTYSYNSAGNQTVTQTVGQAHPDWLCFIDGVGIKMGNVSFIPTVDQTYNASSTNAQSGVAVASGISDTLGTINTSLESIIAQGD